MKKLFATIAAVVVTVCVFAQAPQKMSYQAVIRNTSNVLVANQAVGMRVSILQGSPTGTEVFKETYSPNPQTNANGLVTLQIGSGTPVTGNLSAINWSAGPYFIKTETDPAGGTNYTITGTSQLLSVPYALLANNIGGSVPYMSVTGNTTTMDSALFVVRNNTGQIVFAVYNEGVRIYVDDGTKGTKGGFAIGGFGTASYKGSNSQKYFFLSKDSIRMYLDNTTGKATKGGFAIGGFDKSKGFASYLNVTPDSTRIFTSDTLKGFGVGNISSGKSESYLKLTPKNYFIGHEAGKNITSGRYNSVIGYQSGTTLSSGSSNVLLGYQTGENSNASYNTFLGYQAGYGNITGSFNVSLGYQAGYNLQHGKYNTLLGYQAGTNVDSVSYYYEGSSNVFIGHLAGTNVTTGYRSVLIGMIAGLNWKTGEPNVFIGYGAGSGEQDGSPGSVVGGNNTFIGTGAGSRILVGNENVFLGDRAGTEARKGQNNVLIGGLVNYTYDGFPRTDSINDNVYIGYSVAGVNYIGDKNVMIGSAAGYKSKGSGNVFVGFHAGSNETGSNKLYIDNTITSSPLIWGDFSSRLLNFNGNVGIGTITPQFNLEVVGAAAPSGEIIRNTTATSYATLRLYNDKNINNRSLEIDYMGSTYSGGEQGNISTTGAYPLYLGTTNTPRITILSGGNVGIGTTTPAYKLQVGNAADGSQARANAWNLLSDIRYKTGFEYLNDALGKISALKGFYFYWNTGTDKSKQFGLSAQDVEKVLPEVVSKGTDGYLSVDYGKLVPLLIEGIKDQQQQIESTRQENQQLRSELDELKTLVSTLVANQTRQGNK